MKYLTLIFCAFALSVSGCKKSDDFELVTEGNDWSQADIFDNGITGISFSLRDAAAGFGEDVTISVEGLPSQVSAKISPTPTVTVTDLGVNVWISLTSKQAVLDAVYPVKINFAYSGKTTTREVKLHVVRYNAAIAFAGSYRGINSCVGDNNPFEVNLLVDTGVSRLKIQNLANLGEDVFVNATLDTIAKKITILRQPVGNQTVEGEGYYNPSFFNINCVFRDAATSRSCNQQLSRPLQ